MKVTDIAFVNYSVTDLERARGFYEGTLGLKQTSIFQQGDMAMLEYDIGPGTLAISKGLPGWNPSPDGTAAALEVEDFEEAIASLTDDGVPFVREPAETPVCFMAVVTDPDGNRLFIHKRKPGRSDD